MMGDTKALDLPKLKAYFLSTTLALECKEDGGSFVLYHEELVPFFNFLKPIIDGMITENDLDSIDSEIKLEEQNNGS